MIEHYHVKIIHGLRRAVRGSGGTHAILYIAPIGQSLISKTIFAKKFPAGHYLGYGITQGGERGGAFYYFTTVSSEGRVGWRSN